MGAGGVCFNCSFHSTVEGRGKSQLPSTRIIQNEEERKKEEKKNLLIKDQSSGSSREKSCESIWPQLRHPNFLKDFFSSPSPAGSTGVL